MVSPNIGADLQVCRQAVLDTRRAVMWLAARGYERIGVLGTSLGSCLSMLTAAHEPLIRAAALNHVSPSFADVVLGGALDDARARGTRGAHRPGAPAPDLAPISPHQVSRMRTKRVLLVYARYDLTFPLPPVEGTGRRLHARRAASRGLDARAAAARPAPLRSSLDGFVLTRFLRHNLH